MWWDILNNASIDVETCTTNMLVFFFFSNPKNIYLFVELLFLIYIGTHPSKTGKEILYYNFYHKEAIFTW